MSFQEFYNLTGVDIVLSGVNVTNRLPLFFSVWHTPDFPVIDAVGLSMSIPIVFKPFYNGDEVRTGDKKQNAKYRGLWVDGGMLNNYPIHAFDHTAKMAGLTFQNRSNTVGGFTVAMPSDVEQPFNTTCAGFRLDLRSKSKYKVDDDFGASQLGVLGKYLGALLLTILADASDSQVRSAEEGVRTCMLDPTGLGLVDFSGPDIDDLRGMKEVANNKRDAINRAHQRTTEFWKN